MGWNFRKSVNLGSGLRLNFSKSGIGISGGVKGLRVSSSSRGKRLYASIPGTGMYYTKNLGKGKKSANSQSGQSRRTARNAGNVYQYTQTVTNDYTGETRELRARTQFELNQMVQNEQARQYVNEQRQKQLKSFESREKQVDIMNRQLAASKENLAKIINHTLEVNDRINWDEYMVIEEFPAFTFKEKMPIQTGKYRLSFIKSLFLNDKKFTVPSTNSKEMMEYEERRNAAIAEYLAKKSEFEKEKNKKNGEMAYLKKRFEESDKDGIERYVSIVFTKSEYPADFEYDFDVRYEKEKKTLYVDFLFQDIDSFPMVEKYSYDRGKNTVVETPMKKEDAELFYRQILYSVGIRSIHEVFESVYTDAIDVVVFNGHIEDGESNACAFSLRSQRNEFIKIDLTQSVDSVLNQLELRTIGDFTKSDFVIPFE